MRLLEEIMLPHAEDNMPLLWTFQLDNDPKHTASKAKRFFQHNDIKKLEWSSLSPKFMENCEKLGIKTKAIERKDVWEVIKTAWYAILNNSK